MRVMGARDSGAGDKLGDGGLQPVGLGRDPRPRLAGRPPTVAMLGALAME